MTAYQAYWNNGPQKFTAGVEVNEAEIIVKTAPVLKRFMGQPLDNLRNWLDSLADSTALMRVGLDTKKVKR